MKADGIRLALLFRAVGALASPIELGIGPRGVRRMVPILSGPFEGPRIKGEIMPGGIDWQVTRLDGVTEIEAHYALKTDDGTVIRVINKGYRHGPPEVMQRLTNGEDVDPAEYYFRAVPIFEAPTGAYDWLNRSIFLCSGERYPRSVVIHIYEVL